MTNFYTLIPNTDVLRSKIDVFTWTNPADENGYHWSAEMDNRQEKWLVYTKVWTRDPQQPYDL